jgi:hypothetical protein
VAAQGAPESAQLVSGFQFKLTRSGAFRANPSKGSPNFGNRHPGSHQALGGFVPDVVGIRNSAVCALE